MRWPKYWEFQLPVVRTMQFHCREDGFDPW